MSLIPSESYSFPDHFVRTVSPPRKPVEEKIPPPPPPVRSEPAPKNRVASQTRPVSILPTPRREQPAPAPVSVPRTQEKRPLLRSLVPASLKRKERWNVHAAEPAVQSNGNGLGIHPNAARNEVASNGSIPSAPSLPKPKPDVRPKVSLPPPMPNREKTPAPVTRQPEPTALMPGARIVEAPSADLVQTLLARSLYASAEPVEVTPTPQTRPVSPAPHSGNSTNGYVAAVADEEFAEFLNNGSAPAKKRRSPKLRKFLLWETVLIGILIPLSILGFLRVFQNPVVMFLINITTITAAVSATLLPILFFALAPPLPRGEE